MTKTFWKSQHIPTGCLKQLYMDARLLTRYLFIFWLKNPAAFKDDFWIRFSFVWVQITSVLYELMKQIFARKLATPYYFCIGVDHRRIEECPTLPSLILMMTIALHAVLFVRIFVYKHKKNKKVGQTRSEYFKGLVMNDIESQSTVNFASHILALLLIGAMICSVSRC